MYLYKREKTALKSWFFIFKKPLLYESLALICIVNYLIHTLLFQTLPVKGLSQRNRQWDYIMSS
jgi:hypothetical protein